MALRPLVAGLFKQNTCKNILSFGWRVHGLGVRRFRVPAARALDSRACAASCCACLVPVQRHPESQTPNCSGSVYASAFYIHLQHPPNGTATRDPKPCPALAWRLRNGAREIVQNPTCSRRIAGQRASVKGNSCFSRQGSIQSPQQILNSSLQAVAAAFARPLHTFRLL